MGKFRMVIAPTRTSTIEITIATMGRLIKNFDMGLSSLSVGDKRLGVYLSARTHLLHAFDNHALPLLESVRNNPLVSDGVADLDRADAHLVIVAHHSDLIAALEFRD